MPTKQNRVFNGYESVNALIFYILGIFCSPRADYEGTALRKAGCSCVGAGKQTFWLKSAQHARLKEREEALESDLTETSGEADRNLGGK